MVTSFSGLIKRHLGLLWNLFMTFEDLWEVTYLSKYCSNDLSRIFSYCIARQWDSWISKYTLWNKGAAHHMNIQLPKFPFKNPEIFGPFLANFCFRAEVKKLSRVELKIFQLGSDSSLAFMYWLYLQWSLIISVILTMTWYV